MKVFIFVFLVGAAAAGSGPYLPSGWRPNGPAFLLPGEAVKPSQNTLKDQLFDVEASGSDFLREYGPPKQDVSQDISLQGLPDVETEKPFLIGFKALDLKADDGVIIENAEIKAEEKSINEKVIGNDSQINEAINLTAETTTELILNNEQTQVSNVKDLIEKKGSEVLDKQNEVEKEVMSEVNYIKEEVISEAKEISESVKEDVARINKEVSEIKAEVEKVKGEVRVDEEQVASDKLEIEVKNQQVQGNVPELKAQGPEISSQNVPEGFLEYGPPGFREYGPPKEDGNQLEEEKTVESNETRRRRFSPKFKATTTNKHH